MKRGMPKKKKKRVRSVKIYYLNQDLLTNYESTDTEW